MKFGLQFKTYIQNDNKNLFKIFKCDDIGIDWRNIDILDYGCNQGNYINTAKNQINLSRYTGVDIIQLSIDKARENHPYCNFIHYNKWHQAYNPSGDKNLKLSDVLNKKFDVIICYSIFTHNTIEQAKDELNDLKKLLNPNGLILFTIWRKEVFEPFHNWLLERFQDVSPIDFKNISYKNMAYWINTSDIVTDTLNFVSDNNNSFNTFYDIEWVKEELKPAIHMGIPKNQYQDLFCLRN